MTTVYFEAGAPDWCYYGSSGHRISRVDAEALDFKIEELKPTRAVIRDKHHMYAVRDADDASKCTTWSGNRMNTVAALFRGYFIHDAGYESPFKKVASIPAHVPEDAPLVSAKAAEVTAVVSEKERERKAYIKALCALPEAQGKPAAVAKIADLYTAATCPLWRAASILAGLPSEDPRARAKAERENDAALMDAAKDRLKALNFDYSQAALVESKSLAYGLRIKALEPKRPFVTCLRESGFTDIAKLSRAA